MKRTRLVALLALVAVAGLEAAGNTVRLVMPSSKAIAWRCGRSSPSAPT